MRKGKNQVQVNDLFQQMEEYGENNQGEGGGQDDLKALQKLYSSEVNFDGYEVIKVIGRGSYAKVYLIKGATIPG